MSAKTKLDLRIESFGEWVVRWRWQVVLLSVVVAAGLGSGATGLYFDTSYEAFFGDENPQLTAFEELQNVYTKNDNVLFVVEPNNGEAFSAESLLAVEALAEAGWQLPFAIRVDAVTNFQHTRAIEDDLIVADLVEDVAARSAGEREAARDVAVAEPFLVRRLVNDGASVTGVNVTLQLPELDSDEPIQVAAAARLMADSIRAQHPNVTIYITGFAMLNNAFQEVSMNELAFLMPIMFGAMFLVMIVTLRSVSASIATMLLVMLSVMVAMGLAGFFGTGLTPPSAQAPTIIMTLAIADSIHILVSMLKSMQSGLDKRAAIVESLRVNVTPVFLTTLSTVIGFLSLNFSDVPPFNHLGNMTAAGVTAAFFFSVLFLPALVAILPVRAPKKRASNTTLYDKLADLVISKRRPLLWGSAALSVLFIALIPQNEMDDRFVEYFDSSIEFRTDTDYTAENLTGIYQIEFSLGGGESGSISEPEYLAQVDAFAEWYRAQPGVTHVNTFTDVMKRLNKNMHGDDPSYYALPASRELAAQYLLLYEMSLPYGLDLNNQINVDKSATRLTVTLDNISAQEVRGLVESGEAWLVENTPEPTHSVGSGPLVMFSYISGINIRSMLLGSTLALVMISLLMVFALRSVRLGLLSFIPNLIPGAIAFGIWGLASGVVNLGLSIVIGMTLGIVVDDSIHFLTKYLRARREKGLEPEGAVRYAFSTVGRALTVTSIILVIGFGILSTSHFGMNADMGTMTAITIALALVVDFLFLPPLLMAIDRVSTTARSTAAA
ncbi:MAG: efflux RND transporter permease subunit [Longimicrobiales bacterium]